MRLSISTPLAIVIDADDVSYLRAEDETGAFGVLPGHADFLTALAVSVVSWRNHKGAEHHVAVRGGMLEVRGGKAIDVATQEAVASDDLRHLETEVLATFRRGIEAERTARTDAQRLYLAAIRQIYRFLRSDRDPALPSGPAAAQIEDIEP
ncbi:F0F1 ATP synthase subunit epsilon [Methylocapsa polymorpha]|uniref:F0F1 ATP synthase subunit epsilon n=1 Tax=Methylocapsa polymorpha TaxID=3080828 RepID=A0ABZ0HYA2_9HYPH|nr:F0F1 ATP synthase subunit epsilon [Methylocapsa sp. RX1]